MEDRVCPRKINWWFWVPALTYHSTQYILHDIRHEGFIFQGKCNIQQQVGLSSSYKREFYISVYSLFLWIVPCVHSVHTLKSKNILDFVQYRLECNCIRNKLCVNITHYGSQRVCCVFIMHKTKARRGQESIKTERYMANQHRTCSPPDILAILTFIGTARCSRRTSFLSWIQSIHASVCPLIAFECHL